MKTLSVSVMLAMASLATAQAQTPSWLDPTTRLMEQATSAAKNGVAVPEATSAIIAAGPQGDWRYPAYTVQALTSAYHSCPGFQESVTQAIKTEPNSAYYVISAVQDLESCPCSADNVWPHTRLEGRIRVETRRYEPIRMGVRSNCLAIAAKLAVEQAPEQARAILAAASGDFFGRPGVDRNGRRIIDAVGQLGEQRSQWQGEMEGKGATYVRDRSECAGDRDPADDSFYAKGWMSKQGVDVSTLGDADSSCDQRSLDLVLNDYQNTDSDGNAVEVFNNTAIDLDLERGRYVLDVYGDGAAVPTKTVPLKGKLQAGQALVLAGEDAPEDIKKAAQIISDDLDVSKVNALVLRRAEVGENDCGNVGVTLGMISSGLGTDGEKFLRDTAEEYEQAAEADARQIDAIGTVGKKADVWQGPKLGKPLTVQRQDSTCEGDANARDEFAGVAGWNVKDGVVPEKTGAVDGSCMASSRDLVISEYQNDADAYRSVTIFNNTGAMVDLEDAGYVLEVYGDGADDPTRTIALKGLMKNGSALTIADEDAPEEVKDRANLITGELNTDRINALVLKRIGTEGGRRCMAETVALIRDVGLIPEFTRAPIVPSREPRPGDPIDGNPIGGEPASPN
jgi:hypothetical protein